MNAAAKKAKRIIILTVILIAVLVLALYFFIRHETQEHLDNVPAQKPIIVGITKAKKVLWQTQITSVGTVEAKQGVNLKSEISGRVTKIFQISGSTVTKGTPLFEINPAVLKAQVRAAQASLELNEFEYSRLSELFKKGAVSQEALTRAKSLLDANKANLVALQQKFSLATIVAPFDGTMGLKQVDVGSYVSAGTLLASFQKSDIFHVTFTVPGKYAHQISLQDKVEILDPNNLEKSYPAKLYAMNSAIDLGTRTIALRASVDESNLVSGAYVNVLLFLGKPKPTIVVPQTAVVTSLHGDFVYLVIAGKAQKTFVKTGLRRDDLIAIDSGLKQGDEVVSVGQMKIHNGSKVTNKGAIE